MRSDPQAVAVNPVTNKIYAAFDGEVIVIDGATNAMTFIPSGTTASRTGGRRHQHHHQQDLRAQLQTAP